jgi:uncharacterized protein (TIGR02466 family)
MENNYQINSVFPNPVVVSNIGRSFTEDELKVVSENKLNSRMAFGNSISINNRILDLPEFKSIHTFVKQSIDYYLETIFSPATNVELYVTESWLNWTEQGQMHHAHSHPNSIISGVVYIDVQPNDSITFINNDPVVIQIISNSANIFNCRNISTSVKTGDIIMFPSTLHHMVEPSVNPTTRISLAFNTFAKGELGSESIRTQLIL